MIFVNKFWSHFNYYNLTHDSPDLVSENVIFSIWTRKTFACSKPVIRRKFEICSQLTIKNDAIDIVLVSSFSILNSFHTLFFPCVSVANFEQVVPCRDGWHHKEKASQKNILFHFAITKTYVVICLAEDGTRMGGI